MLTKAPFNEYSNRNLQKLQEQQQKQLDRLYSDINKHMSQTKSSTTTQSMNVNYIIQQEKQSRFVNSTPDENFTEINKFIE